MPIRFACPHCEKTLKVDDRFAGRRAKCPNCRVAIEIPAQANATGSVGTASVSAARDQDRTSDSETPATGSSQLPASEEFVTAQREPKESTRVPSREGSTFVEEERPPGQGPSSPSIEAAPRTPPPFEPGAPGSAGPARLVLPVGATSRDSDDEPFASPFEVFDDDAEIVYADGDDREEPQRFLVSRTRLAIPRAFVYLQGALLVAVAVLFFVLGWAFGGSGAFRASAIQSGPVTISGTIQVVGYEGPIAASEGALVAILPKDRRPAEKIPVEGLRPSEIGRIIPPRTLGAIREIGGALAVSDSRGNFEAELPQPGEYLVLAVLPDVYRPTTSQIALADLARLGDYFLLPDQLIGDCRYALTSERVDQSEAIVLRIP